MVVFPNCKINLGLNIIRKRNDGFHDLETVFYPVPLNDVLEIIHTGDPERQYGDIAFSTSGITLNGTNESNLCMKAYELLKTDFPQVANVKMHLHKTVPAGAGLGGGSGDAAFTLQLLNRLFELKLDERQLIDYAVGLGSDCPFFIVNRPCFATGKGEVLEPMEIDLSLYKLILVNPGIHIHTANAFATITPAVPVVSIKSVIQQPVSYWRDQLKNDFEPYVFGQYPEIKKIKDELYGAGAVYASMSGSGSTISGIFEKERKIDLNFPSHYIFHEIVNI